MFSLFMSGKNILPTMLTMIFIILLGSQTAVSQNEMNNAYTLAGELLKTHSYLLKDDTQGKLDKINRQLRVIDKQLQSDDSAKDKEQLRKQANGLLQDLNETLGQLAQVVHIRVNDRGALLLNEEAVQFEGDTGVLLFRIELDESSVHYSTVNQDYGDVNEVRRLRLNIAANGTTWALVTLSSAPKQKVTMPIELAIPGRSNLRSHVTIQTPEFGRLKVNVLSSDTNKPVPAMIRLVWKKTGQDRKPPNAIEIAPQMDNQGSPSGRRMAQLPGNLSGPYWCVPGPFDIMVPPGEWKIMIRRGVEHIPIRDTFTVVSGETVKKTYQPHRWVDMRKHGWYSGDEHVHARLISDSDAEKIMAWVQAEDVHMANIVKMGDIYRTWFEQRGWGPEYRVIDGDYVLSPGQECPRTHQELGHTIHMNTKSMVRDNDKYLLYDWMFKTVKEQDGISGFCHVLFNMFEVHRGMALFIPSKMVDYIEIMQFKQMNTDLYYEFLDLGFKLTAGAGSDVPWGGTVGEVRMYGYLGETSFSPDAWFESVRRGRVFVTNGPMIDLRVNSAFPGDELTVNGSESLQVKARVWGHPDRFVPTELEIVSQGEVIKRIEPTNKQQWELQVDFEVSAENGKWIAARAKGSDGSYAHTTPVYVVRPLFRFWDLEEVDRLIEKRMASLQEVEDMVKRYEQRIEDGEGRSDYGLTQFAKQGPELLKRVEDARTFYQNLQQTAENERKNR